jgi:MinD-like ATPase involved in chromosome partitioning or flagellar assembly
MKSAADSLKQAGVDSNFLLFLEYTDALKYVADHSQSKFLFMDSGAGAATKVVQGVLSMAADLAVTPPPPPPPSAGA